MTTETENGMARSVAEKREERISRARDEVESAKAALDRAHKQLDRALTPYPNEPAAGAVVRFSIQIERHGTVYHYAALRVMGRWYTTGSSCPKTGWSWHELIDFMREAWHIYTEPYELLGHTARPIEL